MQILLTTFGFFLIFSIISYGNFQKLKNLFLKEKFYAEYVKTSNSNRYEEIEHLAIKEFRKLVPPKEGDDDYDDPQGKESPQKRLTRKLHITSLFDVNGEISEKEKEATLFILKRLITELYSKEDFYQEAKRYSSNIEDVLVDKLIKNANDEKFGIALKEAKDLANVDLDDEVLQNFLYKILKGSKAEKEEDGVSTVVVVYPSLLQYISLKKRKLISAPYLAPRALLKAIFQDDDVVDEIISERASIFAELKSENKGDKASLGQSFKNRFVNSLPSEIDPLLIDFNVSKTKPNLSLTND